MICKLLHLGYQKQERVLPFKHHAKLQKTKAVIKQSEIPFCPLLFNWAKYVAPTDNFWLAFSPPFSPLSSI